MPYGPTVSTVLDVMKAVKRQFGDESGVQLEDADIVRWVNSAQQEIVKRNKILKAKSTSISIVGQKDYTFPSNRILEIESIHYDGQRLPNMPFAQAEDQIISNQSTLNDKGEPQLWYEWGGTFSFWPVPATAEEVTIYYTKLPDLVAASTDVLTIPDKYFEDVVRYVLQNAYEMDEDWAASQAKQAQFNESVNDMGEEERTAQNMTYSTMTFYDI